MWLLTDDDLSVGVEQGFTISKSGRVHVRSVSFWLYLNDPSVDAELTISVKDADDTTIIQDVVAIADIRDQLNASDTYSHGKFSWIPSTELRLGRGAYTITLEQTEGYSSGNYIAWCKDWESPYVPLNGPVDNDSMEAFYFRLYTYKDRVA